MTNDNLLTEDFNDSLKSNFILVSVAANVWTASKPDKSLSVETSTAHNATPQALRVTKNLMAGADHELNTLVSSIRALRNYVYKATLPFSNADTGTAKRGKRLLPNVSAPKVLGQIASLNREVLEAREAFKAVYNQRVQEALAKQGDLADPSQYPHVDAIDSMFQVRVDFDTVPTLSDFNCLTLPPALAQALGQRMATRQSKVIENAMADLSHRLTQAVGVMAKQLRRHSDGEKTKLHKSMITGVQQMAELLGTCNLTNDEQLNAVMETVNELSVVDLGQAKANPGYAGEVADKAEAVLKKLSGHASVTDTPAAPSSTPEADVPSVSKPNVEFDDDSMMF